VNKDFHSLVAQLGRPDANHNARTWLLSIRITNWWLFTFSHFAQCLFDNVLNLTFSWMNCKRLSPFITNIDRKTLAKNIEGSIEVSANKPGPQLMSTSYGVIPIDGIRTLFRQTP